ncbi:DUF3784 domain-containing protein [Bacillus weihaiensis]|uniref:DUF3784 domain-containing protein n=1 Tax=Bacillus weihaiensis TaxID=1547283 RepID=UPI0009FB2E4B|nr:DUF3784 domain-containing protein [Bacillus weihaiensis]
MINAVIHILITIPFHIFAFYFSRGKSAFLLAGYNTLSDEEKAKFDEKALCKFMGKIMYGISFSLLLFGLSDIVDRQILLLFGLLLLIGFIVFALIYGSTKNRFKKK